MTSTVFQGRDVLIKGEPTDDDIDALLATTLEILSHHPAERPLGLIIAPTAQQAHAVAAKAQRMARPLRIQVAALTRHVSRDAQIKALQDPWPTLLVATPSSIKPHVLTGDLAMADLAQLVINDADASGEHSLEWDLASIAGRLPRTCQRILITQAHRKPHPATFMLRKHVAISLAECRAPGPNASLASTATLQPIMVE